MQSTDSEAEADDDDKDKENCSPPKKQKSTAPEVIELDDNEKNKGDEDEEEGMDEDGNESGSESDLGNLDTLRAGKSDAPLSQSSQYTPSFDLNNIPSLGIFKPNSELENFRTLKLEIGSNLYVVLCPHHVKLPGIKPYSYLSLTLLRTSKKSQYSFVMNVNVLDGLQKALTKLGEYLRSPQRYHRALDKLNEASINDSNGTANKTGKKTTVSSGSG